MDDLPVHIFADDAEKALQEEWKERVRQVPDYKRLIDAHLAAETKIEGNTYTILSDLMRSKSAPTGYVRKLLKQLLLDPKITAENVVTLYHLYRTPISILALQIASEQKPKFKEELGKIFGYHGTEEMVNELLNVGLLNEEEAKEILLKHEKYAEEVKRRENLRTTEESDKKEIIASIVEDLFEYDTETLLVLSENLDSIMNDIAQHLTTPPGAKRKRH